jgi:histidyl-tRNA synthetase
MALSNLEIADNIINLLNKVKDNEAFNDTIDKKEQCKLFNKIVKAGIKGQTKINIKTFKKEPNKYNNFIKDMMPSVKQDNPRLSSSEIFKIIGALWTKDHPKKPKKTDNTKEPDNTDNTKEPDNTDNTKEPDNTDNTDNTKKSKKKQTKKK